MSTRFPCSGEAAAHDAGREDPPAQPPEVDYPMLWGRLRGLILHRDILTDSQFAAAFADIEAEYEAQIEAMRRYYKL